MRNDLRYTPNTVFDSFPWPQAPTDEHVVDVAARILDYREQRTAKGLSLAKQYDTFRDPRAQPTTHPARGLDAAIIRLYGFVDDEDLVVQVAALTVSLAQEERGELTRPPQPGQRRPGTHPSDHLGHPGSAADAGGLRRYPEGSPTDIRAVGRSALDDGAARI